jgi:hypothetical protein
MTSRFAHTNQGKEKRPNHPSTYTAKKKIPYSPARRVDPYEKVNEFLRVHDPSRKTPMNKVLFGFVRELKLLEKSTGLKHDPEANQLRELIKTKARIK